MCKYSLISLAVAIAAPVAPLSIAYGQEQNRIAANELRDSSYLVARVVGYNCDGASGPLLASEEDQLPLCAAIEPLPQPWAIPLTLESE